MISVLLGSGFAFLLEATQDVFSVCMDEALALGYLLSHYTGPADPRELGVLGHNMPMGCGGLRLWAWCEACLQEAELVSPSGASLR